MTNLFNPLNPMNHSCYTEYEYPGTIEEVVQYYDSISASNKNGPKLKPQLTEDEWCNSENTLKKGSSFLDKIKSFFKF